MLWLLVAMAFAQSDCIVPADVRSGRPTLSGEVETVDSDDGLFRLHFTRQGEDAPGGDEGEDGLPVMVGRIFDGLQFGDLAFQERGYQSFYLDEGAEGSDAIDVYITQLDSNGYANAVTRSDGETSCYIRIDPDLGSMGGKIVQSVAIHELHHCVQFGYTDNSHAFMYEATATYEQYLALMDESLELALNVLYIRRLAEPGQKLNSKQGRYHYAGFLFMKFWSEYGGFDAGRVPALWEQLSQTPQWEEALWAASQRLWGLPFDKIFLEYARYNAFACSRDDGQHYLADSLACSADVQVPYEALPGPAGSVAVLLENTRYSASYARWQSATKGKLSQLSCSAPDDPDGKLRVLLAQLDSEERLLDYDTMVVKEGKVLRLPMPNSQQGSMLAVFASVGAGPVSSTCTLSESEPVVQQCGCAQGGKHSDREITRDDLPSFGDLLDGVPYLPRLITKARAKLRGELDPDLMYCCGGDRKFLREHGDIHPADFLRVVWAAGNDDDRVLQFVRESEGRS